MRGNNRFPNLLPIAVLGVCACGSTLEDGWYTVETVVTEDSCLGGPWPGARSIDEWRLRHDGAELLLPTGLSLQRDERADGPLQYRSGNLSSRYCAGGTLAITLEPVAPEDDSGPGGTPFTGAWTQACVMVDGNHCELTMDLASPPSVPDAEGTSLEELLGSMAWLFGGGY